MTSTATTARRVDPNSAVYPREPICPPWCAGHDGEGYNGWEEQSDGIARRNHSNRGEDVLHVMVGINQQELRGGHMCEAVVEVYGEGYGGATDLTPGQATNLANAIMRAVATIAEAGQ